MACNVFVYCGDCGKQFELIIPKNAHLIEWDISHIFKDGTHILTTSFEQEFE